MSLVGRGSTGSVYQLNSLIAVKRARAGQDEKADHTSEQKIFEFLKNYRQISYLIQCFYQRPGDTFLELAPNGSIAMLLNEYQKRDGARVLDVTRHLDLQQIHQWMKQLGLAAAGLEDIGLIHGDIRPENMLLDSNWDLKLSDFDRAVRIGEEIEVATEPFGRLLGKDEGEGANSYGRAGSRTETFAIGSVYFTLLRGHEPYETEHWGTEHFVILSDKFQNKEFPALSNSISDIVIGRSWSGHYSSVSELSTEFTEGRRDGMVVTDQEWLETRRLECEEFIKSGLVDSLERY